MNFGSDVPASIIQTERIMGFVPVGELSGPSTSYKLP